MKDAFRLPHPVHPGDRKTNRVAKHFGEWRRSGDRLVARSILSTLLILLVGFVTDWSPAFAQDSAENDVRFSMGGLIQTEVLAGWTSDAQEDRSRIGIGLRRTRLRATVGIGPKFGAFIHVDGDNGTFGVLDAFVSYAINPQLRLRAGRMASAQPRAFILTPVFAMDTNERAAISLIWNSLTIGNKGRDFGIDMRYATERGEAMIFLSNGDGSFDALSGNLPDNIVGGIPDRERNLDDLALSFYGALFPSGIQGFEIGGFVGVNGNGNANTAVDGEERGYLTYSAHAYWGALPGSQPIRLKADLIGVRFEELDLIDAVNPLGLSLFGAVAVQRATELFGRFETFNFDLPGDGPRTSFISAGLNFSPSRLRGRPFAQERLTLAYNLRVPDDSDLPMHHLLVLQAQVNF